MISRAIGGLVVALLFVAPLFIGLGNTDLGNDEAIYSYSVDRMLATGDWLTPRSIPVDGPFLEKPPLKFWMIAGAIRAGLLPQNEFGYRAVDALMGAAGFIYLYLFGLRLGGLVAGIVAALATFSMQSILFEHGIRSNNMEAPLFLAYCGGMYHFACSMDATRRRTTHIFAVSLYFVLGFLTKFVAALFLPVICLLAAVTITFVRIELRAAWRGWLAAAAVAVLLIAPWFVYQTFAFGATFWRVILGEHVLTRFTASLDPAHLQPWHYYFSRRWIDLMFVVPRGVDFVAAAALVAGAWRGRPWELRLLLLWWLVPFVAISLGTSKLVHYAYPFMPPLALALGWMAAGVARKLTRDWAPAIARELATRSNVRERRTRVLLTTIGVTALAITALTAAGGPIVWRVGGVKLLQNSSIVRPLIVGIMTLGLARADATSVRAIIAAIALLVLPVMEYRDILSRLSRIDQGRRSLVACASGIHETESGAGLTVYEASPARANHADYYYLSRLGPWVETEPADDVPRITRVSRYDYDAWKARAGAVPAAVEIETSVFVLSGAYAPCAKVATSAGARAVS